MWSPIILMLLEVSILFSVKKTYHFHKKFPLSYDRKSVFVTMKQVDSRETDLLSGEPLSIICMTLQQSRHKMVAVLISESLLSKFLFSVKGFTSIFLRSCWCHKISWDVIKTEEVSPHKGGNTCLVCWNVRWNLRSQFQKVTSRFFPFGWELLITHACSGLAGCNYITNYCVCSIWFALAFNYLL